MIDARNGRSFFAAPQTVVYLLIIANIFVYGLCFNRTGQTAIPADFLLRSGAMYPLAIAKHEYWRLVANGFLHADLFHLTTNMICLALWGGQLEKRVGAFYFIVIYFSALIAGSLTIDATHSGPYIAIGASGAISGILGALLCLSILGRIDLPAQFFIINIGLNVALALSAKNIGWGAHLGGFAGGMIACAVLDLVEKINALVFRCKFPEFAKVNFGILFAGIAVLIWGRTPTVFASPDDYLPVVACIVVGCVTVKAVDLLLAVKKGLAIVALAFAAANALLILLMAVRLAPALADACATGRTQSISQIEALRTVACGHVNFALDAVAVCALLLTIVLYLPFIQRGIEDVGFVGASFRAERNRHRGI